MPYNYNPQPGNWQNNYQNNPYNNHYNNQRYPQQDQQTPFAAEKHTSKAKKVIRTIFFIVMMIACFLILIGYIGMLGAVAESKAIMKIFAKDQIVKYMPYVIASSFIALAISGAFLIFTARQGFLLPLLTFIFFLPVAISLVVFLPALNPLLIGFSIPKLALVLAKIPEKILQKLPLILYISVFIFLIFALIYTATRKPKRVAISVIRFALVILLITFLAQIVIYMLSTYPALKLQDKLTSPKVIKWIAISSLGLKSLSFILMGFGSLFGIFIAKKD